MVVGNSHLLQKERDPINSDLNVVALSVHRPLCVSSSTFRMDCHAEIKIGASDDGQSLVVKKVSEEHNHRLNEVRLQNLNWL